MTAVELEGVPRGQSLSIFRGKSSLLELQILQVGEGRASQDQGVVGLEPNESDLTAGGV